MTQLPIEQPLPSQGTGDKPVPLSAAFASAEKSLDGRRGQFRGCCETQLRRCQRGTTPLAGEIMISDFGFRRCALSGVMKGFRNFDCAEHVRDALEVVCHRREADFDLCTGQPTHQQTRMSENSVLHSSEGMLDGGSA